MKNSNFITRNQYMDNSSELHHKYYSQFVTEQTKQFILNSLTAKDIKNALDSGDEHLNDIKIPFNDMGRGGSWWWDNAPFNISLAKELGAVGKNSNASPSTHTSIGKAMAKILANETTY